MAKNNVLAIVTHGNSKWLPNLLKYNNFPIDVLIVWSGDKPKCNYDMLEDKYNGFEIGALKALMSTPYNQFFLLQDSVEIKDHTFLNKAFGMKESYALSDYPAPFGMYMGKYTREGLTRSGIQHIPTPKNKHQAVDLEVVFNNHYATRNPWILCEEPLRDNKNGVFEEKFGRNNMILENKYIKKYKGSWSRSMIK